MKAPLKLFSNCVITRGRYRSCIFDLDRHNIYQISNQLTDQFEQGLLPAATALDPDTDRLFRAFLIEHELGFYLDEEEECFFPPLNLAWDKPCVIDNAIIDMDAYHLEKHAAAYHTLIAGLASLGCNFVAFRFFSTVTDADLKYLLDMLTYFQPASFISFQLLLKASADNEIKLIKNIAAQKNVTGLSLYGPEAEDFPENENVSVLAFQTLSEKSCGVIHDHYFSVTMAHYSEAQNHNTCLNRKLSVDREGYIRNCPSMHVAYGNIFEPYDLNTIITATPFKHLWNQKKDDINECRDCEFRYVCSDCRAYLRDPADGSSKPLKCGYDLQSGQWESWSKNPLNQESILFYGLQAECHDSDEAL